MEHKRPSQKEELTEAIVKGIFGAIPIVGPLATELGNHILNPLERRRAAWAEEIENALAELRDQFGKVPEELCENESFVSALQQATQIALSTHLEQKRAALRRLLVDSGRQAIPDEVTQAALLELIRSFDLGHIEILRFLVEHRDVTLRLKSLEDLYQEYQKLTEGRLSRMSFRQCLADMQSRMVVSFGDVVDMQEYASKQVVRVTTASQVQPLQVTPHGEALIRLLRDE